MKSLEQIFEQFHSVAVNPKDAFKNYLEKGEKVVGCVPVYTPKEIIHAMGLVPFGAWGADIELSEAKEYFPAFICSVVQSVLELGIRGAYEGMSALIVPSLCDSLKCLGQNWKYAVKDIPFIPMTYPQNRKADFGIDFTVAGYQRVIADLEEATGSTFKPENLTASIKIYNEQNALMREADALMAQKGVMPAQRSDVYKSAQFMKAEEHSEWLKELIEVLKTQEDAQHSGKKVVTAGILADSPGLLEIFEKNQLQVVADDVAAESRQYRIDAPVTDDPLRDLAVKFAEMDHCCVLYDSDKKRADLIVDMVKEKKADGVVIVLTKFCDPDEFDYVMIKRACEGADIPHALIEIDRQMKEFQQAQTILEAFAEML